MSAWNPPDERPLRMERAKPSDYVCTGCGETMERWEQFDEYQHDTCGGLVERAAKEPSTSRYHAAKQTDGRGWMLLRITGPAQQGATAIVVDANLTEQLARERLDDLRATEAGQARRAVRALREVYRDRNPLDEEQS